MGFIGLFDTVESVAGLDNLGDVRSRVVPGLRIYLPREGFPSVVQLVARDEYRLLSRRGRPLLAGISRTLLAHPPAFCTRAVTLDSPFGAAFPFAYPPALHRLITAETTSSSAIA